jgi:excisionase family DNA binding protein
MARREVQKIDTTNATGEPMSIPAILRSRRAAWTAEELAELLSLKKTTIYDMAKTGRMPSLRIGSNVRFDPATTAAWVEQHQHAA